MANLTNIPLEDGFKTSLSQTWTWWTGTVYLSATPNFTFPSWVTTYIVVNPWKSNMQVAEINAYDSSAKTVTVSNITLEKWAGVSSTAQTHNVWSEVIISDNFQFWEDIQTAINSKLDNDGDFAWDSDTDYAWIVSKSLTTAQRTALTPSNGSIVYDTDLWVHYQYIWGAWSTFATWSVANASETVAGKVEIATQAEFDAWTDTWWTGALLSALPSQIKTSVDNNSNVFYWDGSDWVLNITSWTTNLNLGSVYQYSSINISAWATLSTTWTNWNLILKCNWTVTINWTIGLDAKNGNSLTTTLQSLFLTWIEWPDFWVGWAGWAGWAGNGGWTGWAGWAAWSIFWGWGWGGGWDAQNWGAGWNGWYPWWSGWAAVGNSNWNAGWVSSWWSGWTNWATVSSWTGWNAYWNAGWNASWTWWVHWWGWGWAAGYRWGWLLIICKTITWSWTINCNWWAGWAGWAEYGNGWGWGWGGGWGWWAVWIIYWTDTSSLTINVAAGSWWTASWWNSPVAWTNWLSWEYKQIDITKIV